MRARRVVDLQACVVVGRSFIDVVCLALASLHAHVVCLREIYGPDIGAVLLEFAYGPLEVAVVADQLAHRIVRLILGDVVLLVRGEQPVAKFAPVLRTRCWHLVPVQRRADADASIVVDRPLEFQKSTVQFLEVIEVRHE